jgi:hypothetical protein
VLNQVVVWDTIINDAPSVRLTLPLTIPSTLTLDPTPLPPTLYPPPSTLPARRAGVDSFVTDGQQIFAH